MSLHPSEEVQSLNALPKLVRETISNGTTWNIVADIGIRNGLHVDEIGILAGAVKHMLFGSVDPSGFMRELEQAGIVNPKASIIIKEINFSIFKPLHDRMRAESGKQVPANPPLAGVPAPLGTTPTGAQPVPAPANPPPAPRPAPPPRPEPVIPPTPFTPTPPRETRAPVMPTAATQPPAPIPKNYARDPYREPIDENPQH